MVAAVLAVVAVAGITGAATGAVPRMAGVVVIETNLSYLDDRAGVAPGDVITAIGGRAVSSTDAIVKALQRKHPGDTVELSWVDRYGERVSAVVKLASCPPQ